MSDYIQEAAIIADGWDWTTDEDGNWLGGPDMGWHEDIISQGALDALAAQLVRQVDAVDGVNLISTPNGVDVYLGTGFQSIKTVEGKDRTMNTIKCIVDSGVLKSE